MAHDQKYYEQEVADTAYANHRGGGGRDVGYASPVDVAPDMSPFHLMGNSASEVSVLTGRIQQLADRLTGSAPTAIADRMGGEAKTALQPPVFHALRMAADQMAGEVRSANAALDRIERALP
jgi:hypothetical protein